MTPAPVTEVGVGSIAVLPGHRNLGCCPVFELALMPRLQMRDLETMSLTRQSGRGPDSSLMSTWTSVYTRCNPTNSYLVS